MDQETIFCKNCQHDDIPAANFQMHVIHCQRKIQLCPVCKEAVLRSAMGDHYNEFHSAKKCDECGIEVVSSELEKHKKVDCMKRIISCQYCDLELKALDIPEHEEYCGSRTEVCDCGKLIMLKYQKMHLDSFHRLTKPQEDNYNNSDEEKSSNTNGAKYSQNRRGRKHQAPFAELYDVESGNNSGNTAKPSQKKVYKNTQRDPSFLADDNLENYFENMGLQSFSRVATNRRNEVSNARLPVSDSTWVQEIYLPCEFCSKPIVADDLVQHQTGCRPDLFSDGHSRATDYKLNDTDSEEEDVLVYIPCEFCFEQFPTSDIYIHQTICQSSN